MKKFLMATSAIVALSMMPVSAMAETLVVGLDVDAGTLDPRQSRDSSANRVADLIYSGLVHITPGLEAVPDLAAGWESPDPQTVIFTLRPDLKFSDGSPLTAEDVVYTFTTLLDADFNAPQRALYAPISAIEAVDATTVKFSLSAPYAPLLSYLDIGIVSKALAESGHDLALNPVGAGPMKLSNWVRGSEIILEKNENFWGTAAAFDSVSFKVIGDNSARAQAFEAGDLDVIQSPLPPQDIERLRGDDRFGNVVIPGLGVTYVHFNVNDPLLADVKMRQAFSMLIDQETIVNDIYQKVDEVATSILLPSSWAYDPKIVQPAFDFDGAKALFAEAGWTDTNNDGFLDKDGAPLEVILSTHSEDTNRVQTVEFMQAMFEQAGVKAIAQITDWPSFSTNYVQQGKHQIAVLGWLNIVDPDRLMFAQLSTGGPTNWGGYSNAEVDKLLQDGRSTLDVAGRTAAYQAAATILAEELPYYIISAQGYQLFHSKDLPIEVQATPRGNLRGLIGLND
ncbi:ABC transporter substrate-binding protein [Devosia sp. WQ 349]|uniref:ABC transporter substrate-binding protein n=1 Tax=Devosia sp. WQ 349K1 TaxID=2800329 RepID=UPI0019051272|nr:ABC transporter substrate-binding protein [Devosia sp. WQ 349K1]MBK1794088.1 ABC transporter substrate-binding protein [Devosia sp. WQ 349K1]